MRPLLRVLLSISLSFLFISTASAAIRTWDGGGSTNNWSEAANWSGDVVPGEADIATFDATSTKNATVDGVISVDGIDINTGYTGIITQSAAITIGSSHYDQADGTFTGGSATIDLNGAFTLSSGTFTATSGSMTVSGAWTHTVGGTFAHNNGSVTADGNEKTWNVATTETFYNFTIQKTPGHALTITAGDTLIATNSLTLTDGTVATGTLRLTGATGSVGSLWDATSTGTVLIDGAGSQTFTLNGGGQEPAATFTINNASANVVVGGSGTITFENTALQAGTIDTTGFTVTNAGTLTISGGTYTNGTGAKTFTDAFSQSAGTFNGNSATLDFNSTWSLSGGTFNATSGSMTVAGAWTHTVGGTFAHNNGSVTTDGNANTWNVATTETFYNFTVQKTPAHALTITAGDTLIVTNTLSLTEGAVSTGTLEAQGAVTVVAGFDSGTAPLKFSGSATQTFTLTGAEALFDGDINVNKSGGAVELASALTMNADSQDLIIQEGTFDLSGFALSVTAAATETIIVETGGNLQLQGGETITADSASYPQLDSGSTVTYDGTVGPYTLKNYTYHHLTINGSGATFSPAANEVLGGNLTVTAGTFDVNDLTLAINGSTVINGGTMKSGTNTVTFGDAGADSVTISSGGLEIESDSPGADIVKNATSWTNSGGTITYNAATGITGVVLSGLAPYFNLAINSSGSTYSLQANTDVDGSVTLTAGTLDVSGSNYTMTVGASWTDTGAGTFTEGTGLVTFDGTGTINSNEAFENVTINSAGTVTLGAALDADGNLTITAGTLDVSGTNFGITVGGNWAKSGTFTQRSGTVTFDTAGTTSTISGSTTFYNFSCTTANKPLTFTAGTTQTISGALTLTGTAGNLIVLRSSIDGTAWNLNVAGTSSVAYVDVKNSNASGGNAIVPTNSTNSGGNTNWTFNRAPTVASVTGVQASNGTANVTITFIMDDPDDDNTLQAKVEYSLDGGSTWNDPTLSTTGADTSATFGDPSVNNAVTYQVGQAGAYITSSSGANTVTTVWVGATDLLATVNIANARIRITPYDGTLEGTAGSSSNFILDRVSPSGLANLGHTDFSSTQAALSWTAATDTNFNHYEIWSGADESQVIARSGSAVEWDNDNDATLTTASTATTIINNTDPRNKFFKIFAVDSYGNEVTIATYYIGGGQSSGGSSSSSASSSGGSSSSSDEEEEEVTEEEEEEVAEEEVEEEMAEETSGTTWEDFDIQPEEGHWSEEYVKYLEEQTNIVEVAVTQPTFLEILTSILETPNESMPRGNALEFLLVLAGHSLDTMTINVRAIAFEDVSLDDDQAGFIQYAYDQRLVQGYPDGTFQPDRVVNRAEALKLCSYFFEGDWTNPVYGDELLELYDLTENPFTDVDLNAWYAPYLINAYAKGVVDGYGDGTFGPGNAVTYAEFLKIATLMQNIEEAVELAEELE